MCGIIGYVGGQNALPILMNGLKHLEYRGYDSAGVMLIHEGRFQGEKKAGKLRSLEREFENWQPQGTTGLGHTRWATHGPPSHENAHPHLSTDDSIAIVHNGIIENFAELRAELQHQGVVFRSETDSEVLAHMIARERKNGLDLLAALRATMARCEGSWAALAIDRHEPGRIVAARKDSPLVVGLGVDENFLASDVPAIIDHTRRVIYLHEGDTVDLRRDGVRIYNPDGVEIQRTVNEITWSLAEAQKGGEPHFMLKEIKEQPEAIRNTLNAYLKPHSNGQTNGYPIVFPDLNLTTAELKTFDRVIIEACGTAWHAGTVAKYWIEELARIPTECVLASELRYASPVVNEKTLVIAITQSGETEDTKKALIRMRELGATAICVCNVLGSSIPRESHGVIYTVAGPEIGVASTKAYTTQLTVLALLALHLAHARETLHPDAAATLVAELRRLPDLCREALQCEPAVKQVAHYCSFAPNFMYLGRGYNFATALEGALKLKEITYIHAEGYAAGEMKHGPIALVDNTFPVVAIVTQGTVTKKIISNLKEIEARNGIVIAIATRGIPELANIAHSVVEIPPTPELLSPLLAVVPLQFLAYHVSVNRQIDPDKPRNLAKSVTVE